MEGIQVSLLKQMTMTEPIFIRILGFMNTPDETRNKKMNLSRACDFLMKVEPETTIREIKDYTMSRITSIQYYQMTFEFWDKNLKDATTMQCIVKKWPFFMAVRCLHLHIMVGDGMFKAMYKTFRDIGIEEEKALMQTRRFMNTYQNKETDHEYDIAMRVENCRVRLLEHGIKITNPHIPAPTICE